MKDINREINLQKPFKSELLSGGGGRIEFIDLTKGLCIILVVLHHIELGFKMSLPIDRTYLLFFMPLFFLISGMFFKTYSSFRLFIVKKTNTLLVPFLFFYLTTAVLLPIFLHYVLGMQMDGVKDWLGFKSLYAVIWPEYYYNNPIWFIWCLFIMSLMFYLLLKLSKKAKKHSIIVLLALSFAIGFMGVVLGKNDINIGANIDTAMSALPFFCVGYLLKNHTSILGDNRLDHYNVNSSLNFE